MCAGNTGVIQPRKSRPEGQLPEALRAWADHVYQMAKLAARSGIPTHTQLRNDGDMSDWKTHLSMRERHLIEAAMQLNIWEPDE